MSSGEQMRLKIAQIGSRGIPDHVGGVEQVLIAVAPRLVSFGHEVTVYCANWSSDRAPRYNGVRLRYVFSPRTKYLDTLVRSFVATLQQLCSGTDVVHFHSSGSALLAILPRLFGKKTVVTIHALDWQRRKWNRLGRMFLRFGEWGAIRFPNRTIVVGAELKRVLDREYRGNVLFIPNGVVARAPRAPADVPQFGVRMRRFLLFVARLVPEKQPHVLIEAFKRLPDRMGMKLVLAGPEWHSAEYVVELRRLAGGDPDIIFAGEVRGALLEDLYASCRAFVLPSEVEGMSLSLLDAMSFGACVVASDIAPNADVVGDAGVLFRTGDVADLAEKLRGVIEDEAEAERLGMAARRRITAEFSWDVIARQWEAVYLDLFQGR